MMRNLFPSRLTRSRATVASAAGLSALLAVTLMPLPASANETAEQAAPPLGVEQSQDAPKLTNLAHLDFLLDDVPLPPGIPGHTTYRQNDEPAARAPWVYADRQTDGSFRRVGGGPITDPAKGWYAQGAFDADDISRAAVVYLRDWRQNGTAGSRSTAYDLLRSLTYLQTSSGPDAGNVVLWQQSDGTLNRSAIPVEQPDPSDSAESFWLARTVWALGEGYAAFRDVDRDFAGFLRQRMNLALDALQRQSLARYGEYEQANGVRVPAWLIVGSASATAEAVLGLSAYVAAAPDDHAAATALAHYAEGVAALASGGTGEWPFGALLPEANSPTFWHAWGGMQPAALTAAASALHRPDLQKPATTDLAQFTAQLLATGGPDNGWTPTPADRTQIAYGVDSRVEGLVAAADATHADGLAMLAGVQAAWFFGANPAGTPVYDPATGVCVDGIAADGTVNRNCGAESAIHTQLAMLALDAHPQIARLARALTRTVTTDGLRVVEAEDGTLTGKATIVTPPSTWTGSANWSGGRYVAAGNGATITLSLPARSGAVRILPIADLGADSSGRTLWTAQTSRARLPLGTSKNAATAEQGIAPSPVYLKPQTVPLPVPESATSVTARVGGAVHLDAVLVQPVVSHLALQGAETALDVYINGTRLPSVQHIDVDGEAMIARYDDEGRQIGRSHPLIRKGVVAVPSGGFVVVTRD
jgi:hypothetical protein